MSLQPLSAKTYPTLYAALDLTGPRGMCFHRSAALVYDLPGAVMMVGTFKAATAEEQATNPEYSPVPFIHAWVEYKGKAIAPTLIETHGWFGMDAGEYRAVNGARNVKPVTRPILLKLDRLYGLKRHLAKHVPHRHPVSFADAILDAVGYPFTTTPDGGVVPLESAQ